MNRLLSLIRRHPRLFAGSTVVLLAGTALFALRPSGSAHATGTSARSAAVPSSHAVASGPQKPSARPATVAVANRTAPRRASSRAGATGGTSGTGTPAVAPTSRGVSKMLRRATGLSPSDVTTRQFCAAAAPGHARCAGEALVLRANGAPVHPHIAAPASSSAPPSGYTPAFLQQAYDLTALSQNAGSGQTVAIIDAYDDPTAASDLNAYRAFYGLPACTTGCFRKVNQTGGSTPPAMYDPGWVREISLDLDAVSAVCPNCKILLVEADSTDLTDLDTAMQTAYSLGATQISDSWTVTASSMVSGTYTFPGVATVAATGDAGYVQPTQNGQPQNIYPAAIPGVTAAGGTTLGPASGGPNPRGFGEEAWAGAGSGCDSTDWGIHKPNYQTDSGCSGRSYADLSADADPDTGLAVYMNGAWTLVGGTSLATPMIAAYYAITGGDHSSPQWAYSATGALNDIVSGANGGCAHAILYICNAGPGYDGPTGVGSISGAAVAGAPGIGGPAIATAGGNNTYVQSIRSDGATITAGIYPNGNDTHAWIEYWPASGGTVQRTPAVDIGSGTAPVTVTGYPSHLDASSQYSYRLVAANGAGTITGYTYSFTTPATSATTPVAAFTSSPAASTPGSAVSFDATGSTDSGSTIADYSWDFGDGVQKDTGGIPTASHAYASSGTYSATLIVTNRLGQSQSISQTVTVDTAPNASFTNSPSFNAPASFDASGSADSIGNITGYSWDFGDPNSPDNTGTGANPTHAYTTRGSHTVTLTVTNDAGQTATATRTVTVDDPPTGAVTASSTVTTPGTAVSFSSDATSPDAAGSISAYNWNFGDPDSADNTAAGPSADHTYASPGTYTVTVTTTDDLGVSATETTTVTVDAPPTASFTTSSSQPGPGATVNFDANGSSDAAGTITGYAWDFGDPNSGADNTATGATADHTYATRGTYAVTLTVTNDAGQTATRIHTVVVDDPPTATLTPSTTVTTPGTDVSFGSDGHSPDADGSIGGYRWNFGDPNSADNTATGPTADHAYATRGTYTVTLIVTNDAGQSTTHSQVVTVDDRPTATLTPSTTVTTPGTDVSFASDATSPDAAGSISGYNWDFGDPGSADNTATGANADHTYASPGIYTVTVTATDDLGVSVTQTVHVTVDAPPTASFTTSSSQPRPQTAVSFDATGSTDSVGHITGYSWDFGDPNSADNTATGQTANHSYATRGTYAVKLTVTNDAGQSTTSSQTVVVDDPPTATLAPSKLVSTPGSPVTFSSLAASPDTGGSIDYYSWNFGDPGSADNAATGSSAAHTYSSPGTYRVTITVTDDLGVSIQKIVQVTVDAPPAAAFTASANVVTAGSWVSFDASGSSDSVGTITGYRWNFGDPSSAGNTATSRAANHLYGNPGIYPVSLTVTNDAGQTATRSWSVTVNPVPTVTPPSAPTPAPVSPPAPSPAPVRTPLTASLSAAKKQKLASVLPHGLVASLAVSQGTTATFQVTLPASRSPLAHGQTNASPIVLLRTRAQNLGAGTHVIKLKLSRGAAGQLPGTGPIVLTVRVNLTTAGGGTVTRTVKITLTR